MPVEDFTTTERANLRRSLLPWYDLHRRDLPWRNTDDPYRVWVSEIMLQQTRVAAVLPRYEQFLRRFPSVQNLARSREASVLAQWSGLGYYRRARNLHKSAKLIIKAGNFPQTSEAWRALPGIGRYTAAAIASIAFNEPVAVLDGNVERVIRRLTGHSPSAEKSWKVAQELLDPARPGDFNQAMMELGATICLPAKPSCADCPMRELCRTRGRGQSAHAKPRQQRREIVYALTRNDAYVRLVRRSKKATLMPDMWELPLLAGPNHANTILFSLKHSITVTDYTVHVVEIEKDSTADGTWVKISALNSLPLTGLARKILRKAEIIQ